MRDVLVVGAGPAGCATAIHLRRRGRSVLLVDRAEFPRRKCCGEGLFARGVAALAELGVSAEIGTSSVALTGIRFTLDDCSAFAPAPEGPSTAIGIQRHILDAALVERARLEGVDVREGCNVRDLLHTDGRFEIEVDGTPLEARVIVAADGVRSGLRQRAGLDVPARMRRYGLSAHVRLASPTLSNVEVYYERGYEIYVTPVGDGVANVALLLHRSRTPVLAGRLLPAYLELIEAAACLRPGFELLDTPLVTGPFPANAKSVWRDNLVLVGDAAGFFDGITGEGMTQSLLSAKECAAAVDTLLTTGSTLALHLYEHRRRQLGRNSTLLARLNLALATRPILGRRVLRNLARHPDTFARLMAVNSGELGLGALRPRDFLAFILGL